jgi:hypothetical protein
VTPPMQDQPNGADDDGANITLSVSYDQIGGS